MPRRRPFSGKAKKEQQQARRARKRGEETAEAPQRRPLPSNRPARSTPGSGTSLRLESRFVSLPPSFLETTRDLAFSTPLPRPLPPTSALFPLPLLTRPSPSLTVPARPRFRHGQTKKEVEKNEEGVFRKWLANTRATVQDWVGELDSEGWPRSPSWFETNLEVWRQLWRVVEASAIVLVLIDARCPPLHCPPSLRAYLRGLRPKRQFVLVLTKADLVDPGALEGWRAWLKEWWGEGEPEAEGREGRGKGGRRRQDEEEEEDDTQVVAVTSYDLELMYAGGKRRHRPAIPSSSRTELVDALRRAHERLLQPPAWARAEPAKLAAWRPPVRSSVDWDELAAEPEPVDPRTRTTKRAKAPKVQSGKDDNDKDETESEKDDEDEADEEEYRRDPETEPLTIGLVGQPNVGKSSLLNALMGTTRVRASKTPGKTKHFQTILWGSAREVKIVDCPGLVCPSPVPMELQAMAGSESACAQTWPAPEAGGLLNVGDAHTSPPDLADSVSARMHVLRRAPHATRRSLPCPTAEAGGGRYRGTQDVASGAGADESGGEGSGVDGGGDHGGACAGPRVL